MSRNENDILSLLTCEKKMLMNLIKFSVSLVLTRKKQGCAKKNENKKEKNKL